MLASGKRVVTHHILQRQNVCQWKSVVTCYQNKMSANRDIMSVGERYHQSMKIRCLPTNNLTTGSNLHKYLHSLCSTEESKAKSCKTTRDINISNCT